jgi:hypothetical protein
MSCCDARSNFASYFTIGGSDGVPRGALKGAGSGVR